jgi:hypothetical protein
LRLANTLFYKEVLRFWKVAFQTVAAPVLTAILYLLIFGHVLEDHVKVYDSVSYTAFLVPGLVMMSVLQNAFANSSSSLIQSKIMGNLVFLLLTPLSHWSWFVAYVGLVHRARPGGRHGRVRRDRVVWPAELCGAAVDHHLCRAGRGADGERWADRWPVG